MKKITLKVNKKTSELEIETSKEVSPQLLTYLLTEALDKVLKQRVNNGESQAMIWDEVSFHQHDLLP